MVGLRLCSKWLGNFLTTRNTKARPVGVVVALRAYQDIDTSLDIGGEVFICPRAWAGWSESHSRERWKEVIA